MKALIQKADIFFRENHFSFGTIYSQFEQLNNQFKQLTLKHLLNWHNALYFFFIHSSFW